MVTFASPTVLDTCDGAPQMTSSPASGSVFPSAQHRHVDGGGQLWKFQLLHLHGAGDSLRLFVVSNTDDAGSGSLRQAISTATMRPTTTSSSSV